MRSNHKLFKNFYPVFAWMACLIFLIGCSAEQPAQTSGSEYELDQDTKGLVQFEDNIYHTIIVSNDPNLYKAEYEAGYLQGVLQREMIFSARDNIWDNVYLTDHLHSYPKQIPPTSDELQIAEKALLENWDYTLEYIRSQEDSELGEKLRRLMYRLVGVYHGAKDQKTEKISFDAVWMPSFEPKELRLDYEDSTLSFMDIYFINANTDIFDILPDKAPGLSQILPSKCSAFVKVTDSDIYITHNTWSGYLNQSQAITYWINGDFLTMNITTPGLIWSSSDFGYNNRGILFNETTHHATYSEPKIEALFMFWRAALAEQFAGSIDEFFEYISLEASGTYMNGYMVVDANRQEIGLVEMSYKSFVFYKSDGNGGYDVTTKPEGLNTAYDTEMVQPDFIFGVNYPASEQIRQDLKAVDTRPARKRQFIEMIGTVNGMESARKLITFIDPYNPLSIYGRWDLGYGETTYPMTVPDGAIDAKVASAKLALSVQDLQGILDPGESLDLFWMKYGTAEVDGEPFVWSASQWKGWQLRDVPDRLEGEFQLLQAPLK